MKIGRHTQILEIVTENEIETQDELANQLRTRGFNVTQATVSRDIKELRLIKIPSEKGGYKYAAVQGNDSKVSDRLYRMFAHSVVAIHSSNNLIVIKTMSGSANTAAMVVDSLKCPLILGSVAGDDTILIIVNGNNNVQEVELLLRSMTI